jgi:hypothetical protein
MSFNLFGPASVDDIRVGYISTDRGFVDGVTVCEANDYAKRNPGARFIFRTRDKIRYLGINDVNRLTPDMMLPSSSVGADGCPGIQLQTNCGPTKLYFYGGGGVGASGNPIIGKDGALLAVDLVTGGFGYQYPPVTEVRDNCGIGAGAVVRSVLGEVSETVEYYDQEDDFEEYQICPPTEAGYGRQYAPDGTDIGEWDPTLYANLSSDPIRREIRAYQEFLASLRGGTRVSVNDNRIYRWWNTRDEKPLSVTYSNKTTRVKHNVRHPGWGGEYESGSLYKDVTFKVFTQFGRRENPLVFNFVAEDNSHKFSIRADSFPNNTRGQNVTIKLKPNIYYNITASGQYKGKGTEVGLIDNIGRRAEEENTKNTNKTLTGKSIFADFLESPNDNDDLQVECTLGQFSATRIGSGNRKGSGASGGRTTYNLKYQLRDNSAYTPAKIEESFMNNNAISPIPPSNVPGSDFAGIPFTIEWEKEFPHDGDYIFNGMADNIASIYVDNELLFKTTEFRSGQPPTKASKKITKGVHRIRADLQNVPIMEPALFQPQLQKEEQKPGSLFIKEGGNYYMLAGGNDLVEIDLLFNWSGTGRPGVTAITGVTIESESGPISFERTKSGAVYTNNGEVRRTGVFKNGKRYLVTFKDIPNGAPAPVIVDTCPSPDCKQAGIVFQDTNDSNPDYDASFQAYNARQLSPPRNIPTSTPPTEVAKVFNTIDYINKSNRKLWRTNVYGRGGFINEYGVCPFDTSIQLKDNPYAGTHRIIWDNIEFPVDGNYSIEVEVDDNVVLTFQGPQEDVVINKRGFSSPSNGTGKTTETRFFKKGRYKLVADLQQIPGGRFGFKDSIKGINPMALAVNVTTAVVRTEIISQKSWNENPTGVALVIDAPLPPIPQEPVVLQEGRCPRNPIWTTRFPGATQKWYPVNYSSPKKVTELISIPPQKNDDDTELVEFTIYGQGAFRDLAFVFTSVTGNHTFTLNGVDRNKKTRKESIRIRKNTNYVVFAKENSSKYVSVEQGLIKGGTKAKEQGIGESKKIFADYLTSGNDNDDIQVSTSLGVFKSSNRRKASGSNRNTYDLTYKLEGAPGAAQETTTRTKTYDVPGWSKFMNRYAISPVAPLVQPGSDGGGVVYRNQWNLDIPYSGFYALRGTVDNGGRILVDGREIVRGGGVSFGEGGTRGLYGFSEENPKSTKVFLTAGKHTIEVEIENQTTETFVQVDKTIFTTSDWVSSAQPIQSQEQPAGGNFFKKGNDYYLRVGGNDLVGLKFELAYNDSPFIAGTAITRVSIPSNNGRVVLNRESFGTFFKEKGSVSAKGIFKANQEYGPIVFEGRARGSIDPRVANTGDPQKNPGTFNQRINFYDSDGSDVNASLTLIPPPEQLSGARVVQQPTQQPTTKNGVTYSGPILATYRSGALGPFLTPAFTSDEDYRANNLDKLWTLKWQNVNFPEDGQYTMRAEADDYVIVRIDGERIGQARVFEGVRTFNFNTTRGNKTIEMEIYNIPGNSNSTFESNPIVFNVVITKKVEVSSGVSKAWTQNPVGISAILIPPPCPKPIRGKGVIKEVIVDDPGNGNPSAPPSSPPGTPTVPVGLRLQRVEITNPGINYNCGVDTIRIIPDNGAVLDYNCNSFGSINEVIVREGGFGFVTWPDIVIETETGINFEAKPVFEIVRDPLIDPVSGLLTPPEKLIQVTDLVGLKQTGYVFGRAYYGAVFYKDGIRYAGYYETAGELVQVYDTLQESIDAQVTTPPSAILRQGTDTNSNNSRLNIPGTPENLI